MFSTRSIQRQLLAGSIVCSSRVTASLVTPDLRDASDFGNRHAYIRYQIQHNNNNVRGIRCLEINNNATAMFALSSSEITALLTSGAGRPPSIIIPTNYQHSHDMRALAYALGATCATGLIGVNYNYANRSPLAAPADGLASFEDGDVIIPVGLLATADQQETFSAIAHGAGVAHVRLYSGRIAPGGALLQGADLASFALKCFLHISATDAAHGFGAHTMFAFARGISSMLTLRSHCEEGGFTRACFRNAAYPPSSGLIDTATTSHLGIDLCAGIPGELVAQTTLEYFLGCVCCLIDNRHSLISESGAPVVPEIVTNSNNHDTADNIPRLNGCIEIVFHDVEDAVAKRFGIGSSGAAEAQTIRDIVFSTPDPHLRHLTIVPGAWVEPSALRKNTDTPAFDIKLAPRHPVVLPMFNAFHSAENETVGSGHVIDWYCTNTKARNSGAHYFFSAAFATTGNDHPNGLGYFRQTARVDYQTRLLANAARHLNLAATRWNTPHNPIPNEAEGHCFESLSVIRFVRTNTNTNTMPSDTTLLRGTVRVSVDTLTVSADNQGVAVIKTARTHIERYNRHYAAAMRLLAPDDLMKNPKGPACHMGWTCLSIKPSAAQLRKFSGPAGQGLLVGGDDDDDLDQEGGYGPEGDSTDTDSSAGDGDDDYDQRDKNNNNNAIGADAGIAGANKRPSGKRPSKHAPLDNDNGFAQYEPAEGESDLDFAMRIAHEEEERARNATNIDNDEAENRFPAPPSQPVITPAINHAETNKSAAINQQRADQAARVAEERERERAARAHEGEQRAQAIAAERARAAEGVATNQLAVAVSNVIAVNRQNIATQLIDNRFPEHPRRVELINRVIELANNIADARARAAPRNPRQ